MSLPASRMLKKPAIEKPYPVKRISQDYEVLRLRTTRYERRTTDEEDGLFEHPAGLYSAVMEMEKIELSPCHNSFSAGS